MLKRAERYAQTQVGDTSVALESGSKCPEHAVLLVGK